MNQIEEIRKHLQAGRPINPMEALSQYGCFRLSARIHELRRRGMDIKKRIVHTSNRKHFAEYWLDNEASQ